MTKPITIDFKGNITVGTTQLAVDFKDTVDWTDVAEETTLSGIDTEAATLLETESFTTETAFDALNRPTLITQPDGSLHRPGYNDAGMLSKMEVQLAHENSFTEYVENIEYDAKGQRTDIFYGNGSKTRYDYDPKTFRLTRLLTTRNTGSDILQDLNYTYDPVGNIVEMVDDAQQTNYFSNTVIEPKGKYTYDSLYRLLKATGRELAGLNAPTASRYTPDFVPTDGQSGQTLQTYCEQNTYDALGNILELSHRDTCGGTENWKRTYEYTTIKPNNYLQKAFTGSTPPSSPQFTYDAHGNMLEMPHLNAMTWDFQDQLKTTEKTDETTYYVYAGGERVRKLCYNTATDKLKHERIYLGGYEIYREYDASGDLELERTSNHVMDDRNRIAILEVKTMDNGTAIAPANQMTVARYQYSNHLGSAALELNEAAEILSYQEYHPFGSTSYELHTNDSEVSLKRYQYVGKERDGESGLYYYGARYYADWLCRWVAVDSLKEKGVNVNSYSFCHNNPVLYIDPDGMWPSSTFALNFKSNFKDGLALSLAFGISEIDENIMGSINFAVNVYNYGLGTIHGSTGVTSWQLDFVISTSLTIGDDYGRPIVMNTFNNNTATGVINNFQNSVSIGSNFVFNSDGRNQRVGYLGGKIDSIGLNFYNDIIKYLGDGDDRWWTGGGSLVIGHDFGVLMIGTDVFTGERLGKDEEGAWLSMPGNPSGGRFGTYAQTPYDQLLNNGQAISTMPGINPIDFKRTSGADQMWSQDDIHNFLTGNRLFYSTSKGE